jgi:hypothetical protein
VIHQQHVDHKITNVFLNTLVILIQLFSQHGLVTLGLVRRILGHVLHYPPAPPHNFGIGPADDDDVFDLFLQKQKIVNKQQLFKPGIGNGSRTPATLTHHPKTIKDNEIGTIEEFKDQDPVLAKHSQFH